MITIPWCPKHEMQAIRCDIKNHHEPEDLITTKDVPDNYYEELDALPSD